MRLGREKEICWMLKGAFPSMSHHSVCKKRYLSLFNNLQFFVEGCSFFFNLSQRIEYCCELNIVNYQGAKLCTNELLHLFLLR